MFVSLSLLVTINLVSDFKCVSFLVHQRAWIVVPLDIERSLVLGKDPTRVSTERKRKRFKTDRKGRILLVLSYFWPLYQGAFTLEPIKKKRKNEGKKNKKKRRTWSHLSNHRIWCSLTGKFSKCKHIQVKKVKSLKTEREKKETVREEQNLDCHSWFESAWICRYYWAIKKRKSVCLCLHMVV